MNLSKREVSTADQIADETIRSNFLPETSVTLQEFRRRHYVLCQDSAEVGLISFNLWYDPPTCLEVRRIFVHPDWRRRGIAQHLLDCAEGFAKKNGCTYIRVEPLAQDGPSTEELRDWLARNNFLARGTVVMERKL